MSSLFKAGQPKVVPEFTGLQVNTAVQVLPIPIIYGSPRVSINLIYYNGFQVKQVSTGGGKGIISGGKGGSTQIEYFATIILAIGEGQLGDIEIIYQDQGVYTTKDYPSPGLNYFTGTDTQAPWSYVETKWPNDARPYKDTAYVAVANAQLDASATVPQINMVLYGLLAGTCPLNKSSITVTTGQYDQYGKAISYIGTIQLGYADADPASVIYDFLTNSRYGAEFPTSLIDSAAGGTLFSGADAFLPTGDAALQTYCQAIGLGYSMVINNVESANSILGRLMKNLTAEAVWTGEILKFIPYWDTPSSTNPGWGSDNPNGIQKKYFAPNVEPVARLTLDHILQSESKDSDPITYARSDPMLVYNTVRVDYRDRTNFFNDNVVEAKDEANAELYGPRVDNIGLANEFTLNVYANIVAQTKLRRNISVRRKFTFKLGPLWAFLDPMDIVEIPDPTNWASFIKVRIISCEDDEKEVTTYTAEEFPAGAASPVLIPVSETTPPNQGATNVPADPVFQPVIFEPTSAMLTGTGYSSPQVIIGASGGLNGAVDPNWGGCYIWVSLDSINYELLGTLSGPSAVGVLADYLPAYSGSNPDTTDTLTVNMAESGIDLPTFGSISQAAALGHSLCIVQSAAGWELIAYETATLVSANTFALTGLYRAQYGTTSQAFGPGSLFLFMGFPTFFETALPSQYVGSTFWAKLQSFNVFNNATQSLSDCVAYQYTVVGDTYVAPSPATYVSNVTVTQQQQPSTSTTTSTPVSTSASDSKTNSSYSRRLR